MSWVAFRRSVLVGVLLLSLVAVLAFFYLRTTAPQLADDPTAHAPPTSLLVIDLHVARAIEESPLAGYVEQQVARLPKECGKSPLSYLERVTTFLYPGDETHPDWGLVAPHVPPSDVLTRCLGAMFADQSIAFERFAWTTLLRLGLRWGGSIRDSQHQLASPLHGGLVIGEQRTVAAVLKVARGNGPALGNELEARLSKAEQARLSNNLPDALARLVLVPPTGEALRSYWAQRLPGLWPALAKIKVATAGAKIDGDLHLRAIVLASPGAAASLRSRVDQALGRFENYANLIPGLDTLAAGAATLDGDWLTVEVRVPTSLFRALSRLAPPAF